MADAPIQPGLEAEMPPEYMEGIKELLLLQSAVSTQIGLGGRQFLSLLCTLQTLHPSGSQVMIPFSMCT